MGFYIWTNCYTYFRIKDTVESFECIEALKDLVRKPTDQIYGKLIKMLSDQSQSNLEALRETCQCKKYNVESTEKIHFQIDEQSLQGCPDEYRLWIQTKDSNDDLETQFLITKIISKPTLREWRNF